MLVDAVRGVTPAAQAAPKLQKTSSAIAAIGNLLVNDGRPWYERLAAGGSYRTLRFGVSLMDLELKAPADVAMKIAPTDIPDIERAARGGDDFACVLQSLAAHHAVGDFPALDAEGDVSLASDVLLQEAAERDYPPALELVCALSDKYVRRYNPEGRTGLLSLEIYSRYNQRAVNQAWASAQYRRCLGILTRPWDTGNPGDWDRRKAELEEAMKLAVAAGQRHLARAEGIVATFFDGMWGEVRDDPVLAVYWYERAANHGDVLSMARLGEKYLHGLGVKQNTRQGVAYLERAVEAGDQSAKFLLAKALENGWGAKRDKRRAIELYRDVARDELALHLPRGQDARDLEARGKRTVARPWLPVLSFAEPRNDEQSDPC